MNKKGGLLIPFSLVLSALALLLGAMFGNAVGRKNAEENKSSMLDVTTRSYQAPQPVSDRQQQVQPQ
jgi:hypothetical protein